MARRSQPAPAAHKIVPLPGQWQAFQNGELAARGLTAALAAADTAAPPQEPAFLLQQPAEPQAPELPQLCATIARALPAAAVPVTWLTGGAVRDALLGAPIHDLDYVTSADALKIARTVARQLNADFYVLDEQRGTARVIVNAADGARVVVDFTRLRAPDIVSDLLLRDFTINSMAIAVAHPALLLDPAGGEADLRAKHLRLTGAGAIADDAVRALRGVRLANQLHLQIDKPARIAMRAAGPLLARCSAERIRDELCAILGGTQPTAALRVLDTLDLLSVCLPAIQPLKTAAMPAPQRGTQWEHTLFVVERLASLLGVLGRAHDMDRASEFALGFAAGRLGRFRDQITDRMEQELSPGRSVRALLMLAALLHACPEALRATPEPAPDAAAQGSHASAMIRQHTAALKLAGVETAFVQYTVQYHALPARHYGPQPMTARELHIYFRTTKAVGLEVCLLALADMLAHAAATLKQSAWIVAVDRSVEMYEAFHLSHGLIVQPERLLTGDEVMAALHLPQGRALGQLLMGLTEAQAAGELTTKAQALEWVRLQAQSI
jgi:hypothetical protein